MTAARRTVGESSANRKLSRNGVRVTKDPKQWLHALMDLGAEIDKVVAILGSSS